MNNLDLNDKPSEFESVSVPLLLWLKKCPPKKSSVKWSTVISLIFIFVMILAYLQVIFVSTLQLIVNFNHIGLIRHEFQGCRQNSVVAVSLESCILEKICLKVNNFNYYLLK